MKLTRRDFLILSGTGSFSLFSGKKNRKNHPSSPLEKHLISQHEAWVELKLQNMGWNLNKIRKVTKVPVMAVIKANAYGHGLVKTGSYLEEKSIDCLMVCKLQEALELREAGIRCPVHNFGPLNTKEAELFIKNDISQSVFTEEVKRLNSTALSLGKRAKIHIHVDTGMGRMGISYRKALPFIEKVALMKGLSIEGISTTLTEDKEFDLEQMKHFLSLCKKAEKKGISFRLKHAASSAALFSLPSAFLDIIRPGITLYGYYPSDLTQKQDSLSLRPVLKLKSRVAAIIILHPGDSISYHRSYVADKREKIAVIPIGYSDGYPSTVAGKGSILINGERFPVIASITANHMAAQLNLDSPVTIGDEVVLIGSQGKETITAYEVAQWANVSTYKVLIGLNPLLPRTIT